MAKQEEKSSNGFVVLSHYSLIAAGKQGLFRLKCPFHVVSNVNFEKIKKGEIVLVSMVKMSTTSPLLYFVKGYFYDYKHFNLLAENRLI